MKRSLVFIIEACIALLLFAYPAAGGMAQLPKNVSIEVEFKETGFKAKRIKGLPTYQKIKNSQYTKQHIVVSDGLTASIRVGEDVPYIEYYANYLIDHGYVEEVAVSFREVGTKLVVTPKIRGNYIEISITPQISYVSKKDSDVINIKEMATTVLAADGQSISIGGLLKDRDFADYFFKTKAQSNLNIVLTPRIQ